MHKEHKVSVGCTEVEMQRSTCRGQHADRGVQHADMCQYTEYVDLQGLLKYSGYHYTQNAKIQSGLSS